MSSVNKKIDEILLELKELKKILKAHEKLIHELHDKSDISNEMQHLSTQLINDFCSKRDVENCATNLKNDTVKASKKKSPAASDKKKMNIMAYFKYKYTEDPESLYDIISKEEIEVVLKSHESELKSKKKGNLEQAKATVIYRDLISGNKVNQSRLRTKKEQEEESETILQEEIIECDVIEDTPEREDNLVDIDDDSDSEEDED